MAKDTKQEKASIQDRLSALTKSGGKSAGSMNVSGPSEDVDSAKASLATTKKTVTKEVLSIEGEVDELDITSPQLYAYADELLGRVQAARRSWGAIWDRIQDKTIKPLRSALDGLYEVNRDVDKPAEVLEAKLKLKMKTYQLEQNRLKAAEEEERNRAALAKVKEAEDKAKLAAAAATPQVRGRLEKAAAKAAEEAQELLDQPTETVLPKAENSSGRKKKVWKVTDMDKFKMAFAKNNIPEDVFTLNTVAMNKHYKDDAEGMESWPGVEIVDDITIVGGRK